MLMLTLTIKTDFFSVQPQRHHFVFKVLRQSNVLSRNEPSTTRGGLCLIIVSGGLCLCVIPRFLPDRNRRQLIGEGGIVNMMLINIRLFYYYY